jgi:hypothetical protein
VDNNWKLATLRHSIEPKKLIKHKTLPNSQTFATSNRYSTLTVFNEADRSDNKPSNPMELETLNITSKYYNSANKFQSYITTTDKQLTDYLNQPTSVHNLQHRVRTHRKQQGNEQNINFSYSNYSQQIVIDRGQ